MPKKTKTTKKQYTKDLSGRISFRANGAMMAYLTARAETLGETPSSLVRSLVFQQMSTEALLRDTGVVQKAVNANE